MTIPEPPPAACRAPASRQPGAGPPGGETYRAAGQHPRGPRCAAAAPQVQQVRCPAQRKDRERRRRGPRKPPLPAWAPRDLRNRGHTAPALAGGADLKAGAGTEHTATVPPPKYASSTPPAGLRLGLQVREASGPSSSTWTPPAMAGRTWHSRKTSPGTCTRSIRPRRRSRTAFPQSCSSSTGSHTTVEDNITGQQEIRQNSRSQVPSGELHLIRFAPSAWRPHTAGCRSRPRRYSDEYDHGRPRRRVIRAIRLSLDLFPPVQSEATACRKG